MNGLFVYNLVLCFFDVFGRSPVLFAGTSRRFR